MKNLPKRCFSNLLPALAGIAALTLSAPLLAQNGGNKQDESYDGSPPQAVGYTVTITNLTKGISFTPPLVVVHSSEVSLFTPGEPASAEFTALAEAGDRQPLVDLAGTIPDLVGGAALGEAAIEPGGSVTLSVEADSEFDRITVASMLLPTNDGFYAINTVPLPKPDDDGAGRSSYIAPGWDAGTEPNDELCTNIPGPFCGGAGLSEDTDGEGYVYIHPGIHGVGDLQADEYDWRNPVALIEVEIGTPDEQPEQEEPMN